MLIDDYNFLCGITLGGIIIAVSMACIIMLGYCGAGLILAPLCVTGVVGVFGFWCSK